jgi:uncharacterized Zn-binding protein involved in type VI secretion
MFPAARIGDPVTHDLAAPSGVIGPPVAPPKGGLVMIEGLPAAHVGCTLACSGATSAGMAHPPPGAGTPPPPIIMGSTSVLINGLPAARWAPSGDTTACGAFLGDPKLAAARTVLIGGASGASELGLKAARRRERLRQLALGRDKAAQMSDGDERTKLVAAIERFAFNIHGAEMAQLSANVYRPKAGDPPKPTPTGWKNISNDPNRLKKLGLEQSDLHVPGSNYRAQVYEPDPAVFGDDMKTTIAFKGTDPASGEDWQNNLDQGLDNDSLYYRQAVGIGTKLDKRGANVEITGHSLGGGMASGASRASGAPATTFNAAGLHENTVAHYGGTPIIPKEENINVYQVDDEFLTGTQEPGTKGEIAAELIGELLGGPEGAVLGGLAREALAEAMPDALGIRHPLPGHGDPISRHGMDVVIEGIEAQKLEDQAAILRFIGGLIR